MKKNILIQTLPNSLEAEYAVLGSLILNNDKWEEVISIIDENDFFNQYNKIIFNEIRYLLDFKLPIDIVTLSDSLKKKDLLDKIGGTKYLENINKYSVYLPNILIYVNLIKEYSINRQLILTSNEIINYVYQNTQLSSEELLDFAETKIFNINTKIINLNYNLDNINIPLDKTINILSKLKDKPIKLLTGLDTGFHELNEKTLGLQKSEFIIIAARPSLGKTTFALNICENIAFIYKKPVLIFSLEMSMEQVLIKILSSLTKISLIKIKTGNLDSEEWKKILYIQEKIKKNSNIFIDDSSRLTPIDLRIKSRRLYKKYGGLSLIMVDYLQLMHIPNFKENRTLEISEISRSLKSLAKELDIPIIALSQLNRSLEQRSNKRPLNSDLRDSGAIEQDADLIIFIHKEEFIENKLNLFLYELIIGKHRNGPIGILKILFNNKCSKFINYLKK